MEFLKNTKPGSAGIWEKMFYIGVVPAVLFAAYISIPHEIEEIKHRVKDYEENGPRKGVDAPYLNKSTSVRTCEEI